MNAGFRAVLRPEVPDDLHAIVEYLETDSTAVADHFAASVFAALEQLRATPGIGSPKAFPRSGLKNIRSWAVPGFPNHLIYYQAREDAVVVLAVVHGARNVRSVLEGRNP